MYTLVMRSAPGGARYPLGEGRNILGRAVEAAVVLTDPSLSRRHAEIWVVGDRCSVSDLGSRNGTRLNGKVLQGQERLRPGDQLQCGDVVLELEGESGSVDSLPMSGEPASVRDPVRDPQHSLLFDRSALEGGAHEGSRAERRMAVLLQVSALLSEPSGPEHLQGRILELAAEILPLDRVVLVGVGDGGALTVLASRLGRFADPARRPYSEHIVRYVLDNRLAALFTDAQSDERLGAAASVMSQSIRCSICAPLMVGDECLGALYVDNLVARHCFGDADLDLLCGFANQAALALHNARLQARVRSAAVRQSTLERFFPPATVARLMADGGEVRPTELEVTALFSDISGFTEMSSQMSPVDLVALLNRYFPPMAHIVFEREGTLEKYIGDALMAVWGAPFPHPDDADRAVDAAVAMQRALRSLNTELPRPLAIHVGVHSGVVALANIGSAEYLQVATVGDTTNVSARVCSAAGQGEILVSHATLDRLTRPDRWALEPLPPVSVKGKDQPLHLYRVDWQS